MAATIEQRHMYVDAKRCSKLWRDVENFEKEVKIACVGYVTNLLKIKLFVQGGSRRLVSIIKQSIMCPLNPKKNRGTAVHGDEFSEHQSCSQGKLTFKTRNCRCRLLELVNVNEIGSSTQLTQGREPSRAT